MKVRLLQALFCATLISSSGCLMNSQTTVSALNTGNNGLTGTSLSTSTPASGTTGSSTATVQVTWAAAAGAPSQYLLEASVDNASFSSIGSVSAPTTSAYVSGLYRNQTYYFRIRASNSAGTSGSSTVAVVTTPP